MNLDRKSINPSYRRPGKNPTVIAAGADRCGDLLSHTARGLVAGHGLVHPQAGRVPIGRARMLTNG
jgi:hypothetical protein